MRSAAKRVVLEVVGWGLVLAGIAALVLPGPGLLLLFAGLAVLSQQYTWADRWLRPVEDRAKQAASDSVQTWPRIVGSTLGGLWLVGIGLLWIIDPDTPGWWPLKDDWWLLGGWATGLTLLLSGFLALGTIVYSFRRFRGGGALPSRKAQRAADGASAPGSPGRDTEADRSDSSRRSA